MPPQTLAGTTLCSATRTPLEPPLDTPARIRRLGFRKWYERELLSGHAHLVLLLLCAIALVGSAEAYAMHLPLASQLQVLACAVASAVLGWWALRRYLYLLNHAEFVADQAVCPGCDTYARWDTVGHRSQPGGEPCLQVRCRKCSREWDVSL